MGTRARYMERDVNFDAVEPFIGPFFESVQVLEVNSSTGAVLDYNREPELKAIAVGGNRLSRGLTLEGLTVSYFVRRTVMYDTLMQMGRWFGFRRDYDDLTRIYTTPELAGWFNDLAQVEHELREDIRIYETQNVTPMQLGTRILQHPAMLVTNRLKQRFATSITVAQSYSGRVLQTVNFPFSRPEDLVRLLDQNLDATKQFLGRLGKFDTKDRGGFLWSNVSPEDVLEFLSNYALDNQVRSISLPLVRAYLERQLENDELLQWTVAVRGRQSKDARLGAADWGIAGEELFQMTRSRRSADPNSLGVLTEPGDETLGMTEDAKARVTAIQESQSIGVNPAARQVRPSREGLLLLYPISRQSGYNLQAGSHRIPLFRDPDSEQARDIVGLALSFPHSETAQQVHGEYVVGTAGWRPME
ncbi:MAG: Z1 domain-containing protein [Pirellulales bacterium]|nr:Z1 domain-containing protein [Pirellulales bacterium]